MGDLISRQAAIDAMDVLCQEHRYKIPGKIETYSQYNEAWQDALDRAEGAIGNLPSAQPETERATWALHTYMPHHYYCTHCKKDSPYNKAWRYCPNCGCEMEGYV